MVSTFHYMSMAGANGVGFSYSEKEVGSLNSLTGDVQGPEFNGTQGRFPAINASEIGNYPLLDVVWTWLIVRHYE